MKTVIMAGGRGSRLAGITENASAVIPKPMVPVEGKPLLERTVDCLKVQGFTDLILTVGWKRQAIQEYFGNGSGRSPSGGEPFGVRISYFEEEEPMGNAGALFFLREKLTDDFLLLNGDLVFDADLRRFVEFHRKKGGLASVFVHPNDHPYDSGAVVTDENGAVTRWITRGEERPDCSGNQVNAGIHLISPKLLDLLRPGPPVLSGREHVSARADLDRDLLKPLAGTGKLFAYRSPEYVKDCGTPRRYREVCRDWKSGLVAARSLRNRQKAVFLDRDGTVNRHVGFLTAPEQVELLPGAAEGIRLLNRSGWLVILVTNQPVIARGEVTEKGLREIHGRLETLLGEKGAWLDAVCYCPHHPDSGFPGERPELKIQCGCRKPEPGMLLRAAAAYRIDLEASWMAGDSRSDIAAGQAAGCRTALVENDSGADFGQTAEYRNLLEFAERLTGQKGGEHR